MANSSGQVDSFLPRKSLSFFWRGPSRRREFSFWSSIFVEDIGYASIRVRDKLSVDSTAEEFPLDLARILGTERSRWIKDEVDRFIGDVIGTIAYEGRALFEVVRAANNRRHFRLVPFPILGKCVSLPGFWLQRVPKECRDQTEGKRTALIKKEHVWEVRLPKELGTPSRHRTLLAFLDRQFAAMPEFVMQDPGMPSAYSWKEHHVSADLAVTKATRKWGWTGRMTWKDSWLESVEMYRLMTFARNQRLLVEHVLASFNQLLAREGVGGSLGLAGPTVAEFDRMVVAVMNGEKSFVEGVNFVFGRQTE